MSVDAMLNGDPPQPPTAAQQTVRWCVLGALAASAGWAAGGLAAAAWIGRRIGVPVEFHPFRRRR